jgi:cytochrome c peroxidase
MAAAFATRAFSRSALRAVQSTPKTLIQPSSRFIAPTHAFRQQSRRGYSTEPPKSTPATEAPKTESPPPPPPPSGINGTLVVIIGLAGIGGGAYLAYTNWDTAFGAGAKAAPFTPKFEDYQKIYDIVAKKLQDEDDYDDGSYAPVLLRLAWHSSGT